MSYKIGQIRKNTAQSYLNDIQWTPMNLTDNVNQLRPTTIAYGDKIFSDFYIDASANPFTASNTYYLRFTINRFSKNDFDENVSGEGSNDPARIILTLKLLKEINPSGTYPLGTYQIIERSINFDPYLGPKVNSREAVYETVFTPNDNYDYLCFILQRTSADYMSAVPRSLYNHISLEGENGDVATIQNILPQRECSKIGIQTRPGVLTCVNHEPIRVGRTGTYEVHNGIKVNFFGIVAPNGSDSSNVDQFILDYAWDE